MGNMHKFIHKIGIKCHLEVADNVNLCKVNKRHYKSLVEYPLLFLRVI